MAAPLTKTVGVRIFSDTEIIPGVSWDSTIQNALEKATVAILLVSRHFLGSQFITDVELPCLLQARKSPNRSE